MKATCDRLWEIDALREGRLLEADVASNARHRAICPPCRQRFAADERLAQLARELPVPPIEPLRARRLRAQVLRGVAQRPSERGVRWPLAAGIATAALAAGIAVLVLWPLGDRRDRPSPVAQTTVTPSATPTAPAATEPSSTVTVLGSATWTRRRDGEIETIRLSRGAIALRVRKQRPSERFFVELPDGRIEVRGTEFDVHVDERHTIAVTVREGVVALLREGEPEVLLEAGDAWPPRDRARTNVSAADAPDPTADEYEAAVALYRTHAYAEAAAALARFTERHPQARQTEDAAFLRASALAYASRADDAEAAAQAFLTRYPASIHAKDAAILVARAARDRGECDRARTALAPWRGTADTAAALGRCATD